MKSNSLQLNSSKTEVMWCATSQRQHIQPASALSDDGVRMTRWRQFGPWHLHPIRPQHQNSRTVNRVVVFHRTPPVATDSPAYTTCHVPDTGSSLGSVTTGLWKRCSDHIPDALASLHRLHVPEHIQFKITVLAYKVLHETAPRYLGPLVCASDLPGSALSPLCQHCLPGRAIIQTVYYWQ